MPYENGDFRWDISSVCMKGSGFRVAVDDLPVGRVVIRMNVDNKESAIKMLTADGTRAIRCLPGFNITVSPSGYIVDVIRHIEDLD